MRRREPSLCSRSRGSSLIEVLVASAMLALLIMGILQMFSVSLLTDYGSAARTDLTYKCQQVVENLRYVQFLKNGQVTGVSAPLSSTTGIPDVPVVGDKITLPYKSGDSYWAYWGPAGANVMEDPAGGAYQIFYRFADNGVFWTVTVTAQPTAKASGGATTPGSGKAFLSASAKLKSVEYVAQLRKNP